MCYIMYIVVRQAMQSLGVYSRNASKHELKILKSRNILPQNAPSASW